MDRQLAQQDYMRLLNLQSIHTLTVSKHRNRLKERLRSSRDVSPSVAEQYQNGLPSLSHAEATDSPTDFESSNKLSRENYQPINKRPRLNGPRPESLSSHKHSLILRRNKEGEINPEDLKDWQRRIQILVRNNCKRAIEERNFLPPELKGHVQRRAYTLSTKSEYSSTSSAETVSDEYDRSISQKDLLRQTSVKIGSGSNIPSTLEDLVTEIKSNQPKVTLRNILLGSDISDTICFHLPTQPPLKREDRSKKVTHNFEPGCQILICNEVSRETEHRGSDQSKNQLIDTPKDKISSHSIKTRHEEMVAPNNYMESFADESREEILNHFITEKQKKTQHQRTHLQFDRVNFGLHVEKFAITKKSQIANGSLSPTDKENIHKKEKNTLKVLPRRNSIIQTRQGLKRRADSYETLVREPHHQDDQPDEEGLALAPQIEQQLTFNETHNFVKKSNFSIEGSGVGATIDNQSDKFGLCKVETTSQCVTSEENLHLIHEEVLSERVFDHSFQTAKGAVILETKSFRQNGRKVCYPEDLAPQSETYWVKNMIQPGVSHQSPQKLRDRQLMNAVKAFTSPKHVPISQDVLQLMIKFNNSCHAIIKNEPWHTAEIVRAINKYAQLVAGMSTQQQTSVVPSKGSNKVKGDTKDQSIYPLNEGQPLSDAKIQRSNDDVDHVSEAGSEYVVPRQSLQRKAKDDAAQKEQQAREKLQVRRNADPNLNLLMLAAETVSMTSSSISELSSGTTRDDCSSEHECETIYRCHVCQDEFVNVIDLSVHRYEKHKTCTKCNTRFGNVRKRSMVQPELCVPCFKSIPKVEDFEESEKCFQATFNVLKSTLETLQGTEARHDCLLCSKNFETNVKMKKHLLSQHSDLLHTIDLNRLVLLSGK